MRIKNVYKDKDDMESITLLTRSCISSIRQLRSGEPLFKRPAPSAEKRGLRVS